MTTPYPSDMQRNANIFTRNELYGLLRFHLAQTFARIPEGVTLPSALSKLKVDAIRELIVTLRIPCTRDTVRVSYLIKDTYYPALARLDGDQYYEAFTRYRSEAEKLQLPSTPPKPPTELELANEELAKCKKKYEDKLENVRGKERGARGYEVRIEQMRIQIRGYEERLAYSLDQLKKMKDERTVAKGMADHAWWEWTNAAEKVDKLDKTVETCSVCMDEKKSSQLFKTDCKHPLCTDCFTRMREYAAPSTMAAPSSVPCPMCRAPIST